MTDEERIASLFRNVGDHEDRLRKIETQAVRHNYILDAVNERTKSIENGINWVVRLVMGAIIMGIVSYALAGGLVTP